MTLLMPRGESGYQLDINGNDLPCKGSSVVSLTEIQLGQESGDGRTDRSIRGNLSGAGDLGVGLSPEFREDGAVQKGSDDRQEVTSTNEEDMNRGHFEEDDRDLDMSGAASKIANNLSESCSVTLSKSDLHENNTPPRMESGREGLVRADRRGSSGQGYQWHQFVGRRITERESVEFQRQVDHLEVWADQWSHTEKCTIIDNVLKRSNVGQFNFLWTTLQPVLHRDFMYAAQLQFPEHRFPPISTHVSRETRAKRAVRSYHHVQSAYLKNRDDVLACNPGLAPALNKLPHVTGRSKSRKDPLSQSLPAAFSGGHVTCRSAPEISRRPRQPIRRHMDDNTCDRHLPGPGGDRATYGYHPVREEDFPRLVKSISDIRLNRGRQTMSGTSPRRLPPVRPIPSKAWQLLHWYSTCWNDVERNEFLHRLLKTLDARQLYYVTCNLSLKQSRDYMTLLPEHLALRILAFLTPDDLLTCAQVSKSWQRLSGHDKIWKKKCDQVDIDVPIPSAPSSWKQIYKENVYLKYNWQEGRPKIVDLRGHTAKVHCIASDGHSRLASGSKDNTVRLWDIYSGQLMHTFRGHTKGVWSIQFFTGQLLVSGSYDGAIKVWSIRTGLCTRTLLGHEGCVWGMALKKHYLASASQDKSVKVWDLDSCSLMHTLTGHLKAVFCADMDDQATVVISGSGDRTVRIWNLHSGELIKTLWVSRSTSVMSISYSRGYFACSVGERVSLWRVETGACIRRYQEHEKRVESVGLRVDSMKNVDKPKGLLVTAGEEGLVKYWNLNSRHSNHTLRASHGSQVYGIYFDETKIVSACADYRIRVWNFHSL